MIRISSVAASVAAALALAHPAAAGASGPACAAPSHHAQLVCSSDACLRLETQMLCEATAHRGPVREHSVRPVSPEERSNRALDRLIATID